MPHDPSNYPTGDRHRSAGPGYPAVPGYAGPGGYPATSGYPAYPGYPASTSEPVNLLAYWQVVRERLWIFISVFAAVLAGVVLWTARTTPLYRAASRLQVERQSAKLLPEDIFAPGIADLEMMNTYVENLKSLDLAEKVLSRIRDQLRRSDPYLDALKPGSLAKNVMSFQLVRNSRIIEIKADTPTPELSALFANAYPEIFIRENLDLRMNTAGEATKWLEREAEGLRKKVEESERALQEYRKQNDMTSLLDTRQVVVGRLQQISTSLTEANTAGISAERLYEEVKRVIDRGNLADAVLPTTIPNRQTLLELQASYAKKSAELAALEKDYLKRHPKVQTAQAELAALHSQLEDEMRGSLKAVEADLQLARAKETELQKAFAAQRALTQELDEKAIQYGVLERDVQTNKNLFEALLERMKETSVSAGAETNNLTTVEKARIPIAPFKPSWPKNIALGIVVAGMLSLGLVFFFHTLDDRVKSQEDVEQTLGIPFMGYIPRMKADEQVEKDQVVVTHPHSTTAETFRTLRTSLGFTEAADSEPMTALVVTSAGPQEGKSLISSNMAIAYAQQGKRTLLIDADMRRPRVHHAFGLKKDVGLAHVLAGLAGADAAIQATAIPSLDAMVVGPIPPNPAELLASARMRDVLAWARSAYDMVVIDTPPISAVADALILGRQAAGVMLVIKFRKVRRQHVHRAVRRLQDAGVRVFGAVVNDIDTQHRGYYHYYAYYHDHYYGHDESRRAAAESLAK